MSGGRVGTLGAMSIGIGGMVGGGIFAVLGEAVTLAGGGTPIAFLFAGVVALLTAYSYTKLAVRFPGGGGTVVYLDRAFGVSLLTGSSNVLLWLSYLVTIALYASAFGAYGATFFPDPTGWLVLHGLISAAILLPTLINLLDAELLSRAEGAVVAIKLVLLAVVIVSAAPHVDIDRIAPASWSSPLGLAAAGMVIFVAYEGFELIANAGDDVRDPERTLPRAFLGSVVFVAILYVLVAIVTVGAVPAETIRQAKEYALAEAARPALGQVGFTLVAVAALLATLSAINATVYGNARLGFRIARDREMPELLERRTWNRPVWGVLITAGLSLVLANLADLRAIATMGSAGFLIVFTAVNAAAIKLAGDTGGSAWISGTGLAASAAAFVILVGQTASEDPGSLAVLGGLVAASVLFELVYARIRGREIRLARPDTSSGG